MNTPINPPGLQRMLVALDPFDSNDLLEGYVYRIASWSNADVVLLLVCELAQETLILFRKQLLPPEQLEEEIQSREKALEPQLMDLAVRLRKAGIKVFPRLAHGRKIGDMILKAASAEGAQLIVMGNRSHGAIKSLLIGSVTDYVLHRTDIPLLIIPDDSPRGGDESSPLV